MWLAAVATGIALAAIVIVLRGRRRVPAQATHPATAPASKQTAAELRKALAEGDLGGIALALSQAAGAQGEDIARVRERLEDSAQREALDVLQAARWGGGDAAAALAILRKAFAGGPRWRHARQAHREALPPLYPEG